MLVGGVAASMIVLLAGSAALAADVSPGDGLRAVAGNAGRGANARGAGFGRAGEWPDSSPILIRAAGGLFRDDAISSRRMARHPLEAERPRRPGLAHRGRRSGAQSLRRPAPERAGGRASRPAGRIRLAEEFGPDRRPVPGDAGRSLGPQRRCGRRHPRAATPQRSLRTRQYRPARAIRLGSKAVRRPDRNHRRPPRLRRRVFQLPLRLHQSDLLPRAGGQPGRRLHLQLAGQPMGGRRKAQFRVAGLSPGRHFRLEHRPISTPRPTPPFGQPRPRTPRASLFRPKSPGRQNSARFRGATRSAAGGTTARRRMSRPASMASRSWCRDCPGFPATGATVSPPCCSSSSLTIPRSRIGKTG